MSSETKLINNVEVVKKAKKVVIDKVDIALEKKNVTETYKKISYYRMKLAVPFIELDLDYTKFLKRKAYYECMIEDCQQYLLFIEDMHESIEADVKTGKKSPSADDYKDSRFITNPMFTL